MIKRSKMAVFEFANLLGYISLSVGALGLVGFTIKSIDADVVEPIERFTTITNQVCVGDPIPCPPCVGAIDGNGKLIPAQSVPGCNRTWISLGTSCVNGQGSCVKSNMMCGVRTDPFVFPNPQTQQLEIQCANNVMVACVQPANGKCFL